MRISGTKRILVVEDEPLVAMLIQDMLDDLGFAVIGPALRVDAALGLVDAEQLDAAILDVNLGRDRSYPVAEKLAIKGVPFIFATGYGSAGAEWCDSVAILRKPFEQNALAAALATLFDK